MIYVPLTKIQYHLYSAILNKDMSKLIKVKEESLIIDVNGVRPRRKCRENVKFVDFFSPDYYGIDTSMHTSVNVDAKLRDIAEWKNFTQVTEENSQYLIRVKIQNSTMMYRHVVNHPYIIHYPLNVYDKTDDNIIEASGKLLVLDAMLKKLKAKGHKILLFSSMKMVLDVIEDYLSLRDYSYVRLDGDIKFEARKKAIDEFQTNLEVFLFLLTTKPGAVCLNIAAAVAADTVIICDSDWNPQNDLQAMARCHTIGQTKPVGVYRLCTKGSIDEIIIKRANAKRFLEEAVISKEGRMINSEGVLELKKLLEKEILSKLLVDSKSDVYTDAELEDFLDRSDLIFEKKGNCSSKCDSCT